MAEESLQYKLSPPSVIKKADDTMSNVGENAASNAKILAGESLETTTSMATKILEGTTTFFKSDHHKIWWVILISSFIYSFNSSMLF